MPTELGSVAEPVADEVPEAAPAEEEDDEQVVAAEVVPDDDQAVASEEAPVAEAEVVVSSPTPKKSKSPPRRKKPTKKKSSKKRSQKSELELLLNNRHVEAARDARATLRETVPTLPIPVAETQVRSFGRILLQNLPGANTSSSFCSISAIYPVGFSCDRHVFSPVHGRNIKMRCSILDGRSIKRKGNFPDLPDGPIFRILWGRGVDESEESIDYPFDLVRHAPPLVDTGNAHNNMLLKEPWRSRGASHIVPKPGMRVKVRFAKADYGVGTVTSVSDSKSSAKKKRKQIEVTVQYDDGLQEILLHPDPDLELLMPGVEEELGPNGEVEIRELDGKPVHSVVGTSPLEAWGKTLVKLGLIDEIMLERGLDAVQQARSEGLEEAKARQMGTDKKTDESSAKSPSEQPKTEGNDDESTNEKKEGSETSAKERTESTDQSDKKEKEETDEDVKSRKSSPDVSTPESDETKETDSLKEDESKETEPTKEEPMEEDREPVTAEERQWELRIQDLLADLEAAKKENEETALELANARIYDMGPFMCNPFHGDDGNVQQNNWLATAVRKEKSRMGSTGNRKKIVTAVDLLERNDTLYNADIEALIEGLPGSECCDSYVFQAFRSGGASLLNRSWIHEAQLLNERESKERMKRSREWQAREDLAHEKQLKRRALDELRDSRKRQRIEEEDEKKRSRAEERLSKLEFQINSRLFKESSFQREKVIQALTRSLSKEYTRRRKVCETLAVQAVLDGRLSLNKLMSNAAAPSFLPPATNVYSEDTVRVWNFMATFKSFFLEKEYVDEIPTLHSLQSAIDCLEDNSKDNCKSNEDAVVSLTGLSVALCKPLAATLTRSLFASLIALNPALQKDFGATFFNGINATKVKDDKGTGDDLQNETGEDAMRLLLPVNDMTWQEIARLAFLSDALGELGLSKHEAAHLLRGYRSAGHPNSKESRRLRKIEDFPLSIIRQQIAEGRLADEGEIFGRTRTRIDVPCCPQTCPERPTPGKWQWLSCGSNRDPLSDRRTIGLLSTISLSSHEYKNLCLAREDYMEEALILKEEMERQERAEGDEESDDDDDDDSSAPTRDRSGGSTKDSPSRHESADDSSSSGNSPAGSKKPPVVVELNGNGTKESTDSAPESGGAPEKSDAPTSSEAPASAKTSKVSKESSHDDFSDIPSAPDLIRRCLAVLRTLSASGPAEYFIYPVDPQTNPGYYEILLRPMCLTEVGKHLKQAAMDASKMEVPEQDQFVEEVVVNFGRNIRQIADNSVTYTNAGPMVIAAASELLKIFERLLFDWVLAPGHLLPPLEQLDDDRCVESHPSDEGATVLLCDGCEGKYNIARLDPPLSDIPRGDWYCPRCISGRWYGTVDPRLGKEVQKVLSIDGREELFGRPGRIEKCKYFYPEGENACPSLAYLVRFDDGDEEYLSLSDVDKALRLANNPVPPVRCLRAVAESPGYSLGIDAGLQSAIVPAAMNPNVSDASAQIILSSSVFRDTLTATGALLLQDPREFTASEWSRLLVLLVMKCSSSEVIQNVINDMENAAAEKMLASQEKLKKAGETDFKDILPYIDVLDDEDYVAADIVSEAQEVPPSPVAVPSQAAVTSKPAAGTAVVDATAVEVVDEMEIDQEPQAEAVATAVATKAEEKPETPFAAALKQKATRQKAAEDSFSGYSIKNQMKATMASFEEDYFSPAVDSCLTPEDPGLSFSSLRCRRMTCAFCGLTDTAVGSPLLRVPDEEEWEHLIAHVARSRHTRLVAEIPSKSDSKSPKLVSLSVVLDGELVSYAEPALDELQDSGMLEFPPRSENGFQSDLAFRYETGLPFVSGSLSAHESCAVAVHCARRDQMLEKYKERESELIEKEAGMQCGRTLEIGRDIEGRSYWKFGPEPDSLFVCENRTWSHFTVPEGIASVLVGLKKDPVVKELQRAFPEARQLVRDGTWSDLILKRRFPNVAELLCGEESNATSMEIEPAITVVGGFDPYLVGEEVLVESKSGEAFWDATVEAVSEQTTGDKRIIDAYKVQYKEWGRHFVEWVKPSRIVEPGEHNRLLQEELLEEKSLSQGRLPTKLNMLSCKDYFFARDRARGSASLPDFAAVAHVDKKNPSSTEETFALMKVALLAIEAALPYGSVDTRENGQWRAPYASQWRFRVLHSEGPAALMQCVILLETVISEDWFRLDVTHLRSCLSARWKAVAEASPASLAIRIILLDRAILYGNVDKKRFAKRKKKIYR